MATIQELATRLTVDDSDFRRGMDRADKSTDQFERKIRGAAERAAGAFQGLLGTLGKLGLAGLGISTVTAAVSAFTDAIGNASKAAAEDAASQARLNTTLQNSIPNWQEYASAIEASVTAGQRKAFSDDAQRASLELLVGKLRDVPKALEFQATAMDLAAAKRITLEQATRALIRADDESIGALRKLGIAVSDQATAEENLAAVRAQVAGQAEQYANSQAGATQRISDAWGEVQEAVGYAINEVIGPALIALADWVQSDAFQEGLGQWIDGLRNAFQIAGDIIGGFLFVIDQVGKALEWLGGIFDVLSGKVSATGQAIGGDFASSVGESLDSGITNEVGPATERLAGVLDVSDPAALTGTSVGAAFIARASEGVVPTIDAGSGEVSAAVQRVLDVMNQPAVAAQVGNDVARAYVDSGIITTIQASMPNVGTAAINLGEQLNTSTTVSGIGDQLSGAYVQSILDRLAASEGGISGYANNIAVSLDKTPVAEASGANTGSGWVIGLEEGWALAPTASAAIAHVVHRTLSTLQGAAAQLGASTGKAWVDNLIIQLDAAAAQVSAKINVIKRALNALATQQGNQAEREEQRLIRELNGANEASRQLGGYSGGYRPPATNYTGVGGYDPFADLASPQYGQRPTGTAGSRGSGAGRGSGRAGAEDAKAEGKAQGEAFGEGLADGFDNTKGLVRGSLRDLTDLTSVHDALMKAQRSAIGTMDEIARGMIDPKRNPGAVMGNLLDLAKEAADAGWNEIAATAMGYFNQIRSGASVDFGAMATEMQAHIEEMRNSSDPRLAALATQYDATWDQMLADQHEANARRLEEQAAADARLVEQAIETARQMREGAISEMGALAREMLSADYNPGTVMLGLMDLAEQASAAGWQEIASTALHWSRQIGDGTGVNFRQVLDGYLGFLDQLIAQGDPRLQAWAIQTKTDIQGVIESFNAVRVGALQLPKDITAEWEKANPKRQTRDTSMSHGESLDFLSRLAGDDVKMPSQGQIDAFFTARRYLLEQFAAQAEQFAAQASDEVARIAANESEIFGGINAGFEPLLNAAKAQEVTPQQIEGSMANLHLLLFHFNRVIEGMPGDFGQRAGDFAATLTEVASSIREVFSISFGKDVEDSAASIWRTSWSDMFQIVLVTLDKVQHEQLPRIQTMAQRVKEWAGEMASGWNGALDSMALATEGAVTRIITALGQLPDGGTVPGAPPVPPGVPPPPPQDRATTFVYVDRATGQRLTAADLESQAYLLRAIKSG